MQEIELNLRDMFFLVARKWRSLFIFTVLIALLAGIVVAVPRISSMNDDAKIAQWQAEHSEALAAHQSAIDDVTRQINEAENLSAQTQANLQLLLNREAEAYKSNISLWESAIADCQTQIADYQGYIQELNALKASTADQSSAYAIDLLILEAQAGIHAAYTNISQFQTNIEDAYNSVATLPHAAAALQNEIANLDEDLEALEKEKLALTSQPEPAYPGYTVRSVLIASVKFAILGGVVAFILAALCILAWHIMSGKLLSANQACAAFNISFFGRWLAGNTKAHNFVDRWIDRMEGIHTVDSNSARELVLQNIAVTSSGHTRIMLCGCAGEEIISAVATELRAVCPQTEFIIGSTINDDPNTITGLASCSAIVLVEQLYRSNLNTILNLKDRAQRMDKPILGMVLA